MINHAEMEGISTQVFTVVEHSFAESSPSAVAKNNMA